MNSINNNETSINESLSTPKKILEIQINKTDFKEHISENVLLERMNCENFCINDLINLNEDNVDTFLNFQRTESHAFISILSKFSISEDEKSHIVNIFEQFLTYSEIVQFCHSSPFKEIINSINQKNKKIMAANKIIKIQKENNFIIEASDEELAILNNLPVFHNYINQYLKLPSGKKGNMLLNHFIYELNIIGKHNYPDNNLTGFLIPILKDLKELYPTQFCDLTKLSRNYLLNRIRDLKKAEELERLKELDKRHVGPGDIIL